MKRFRWLFAALIAVAIFIGLSIRSSGMPQPEFLRNAKPVELHDGSDVGYEGPYAEVYSLRRPYAEVLAEARSEMAGWVPEAIVPKKQNWQASWRHIRPDGRVLKIAIADMRRFDDFYGKKSVPADGLPMVTVIVSQDAHPRDALSQFMRAPMKVFLGER
jgi:hypothetical protein